MSGPVILVVNAGSSSVKFAVYEAGGPDGPAPLWRGQIDAIADAPWMKVAEADGRRVVDEAVALDGADRHAAAIDSLLAWVFARVGRERLAAVGHRIVHGGVRFSDPALVTPEIIEALESLVRLAPLHQPHNVAGLKALARLAPEAAQVACFDTAFHATIPAAAHTIALPKPLRDEGLRRYGFHGLSYAYIAGRLPNLLPTDRRGRVVVAHLGAGASLCAMRDGVSVDTTMGFSPLDGLVMATRCGLLDPGATLYLMREKGYGAEELEALLYRRSGLLGVSGASADMRALLESADPEAGLAVEIYLYRLRREIAAMAAALGGLDALVFTAGVGENAAPIRARACAGLGWLGVELDTTANANARGETTISAKDSAVAVVVAPTDEEAMIARATAALTVGR